ncbi:hypothetical protein Tco_0539412 [Tanacetum coccineum]
MAPLLQRHPFLRYQGLEYTDADIADFEERLERIYGRKIHRVQVVDFLGMPELMRDGLFARMVMEHRDDAGVVVFTSRAWGRLFDTRGPLVEPGDDGAGGNLFWPWDYIPGRRWIPSVLLDFLGPPPSYTLIRDPVLRLCHRMMAHSIAGRSQAPEKVTVTDLFYLRGLDVGSFVARLAEHFRLLTVEILGELTVISPELPIIDMGELMPLLLMSAAKTMPQRMAGLEKDIHEIHGALTEQREGKSYLRAKFGDPCTLSETSSQTEDWRGQHLRSTIGPTAARPIILLSLSFVTIHVMIIKPGRPRERISTNIGGEFTNLEDLEVLES